MRRSILTLGCAFAMLAACEPAATVDPVEAQRLATVEMPDDVYQIVFSNVIAQMIGDECPSLAFSSAAEAEIYRNMARDLLNRGVSAAEIDAYAANAPKKRLQSDTFAYLQRNDIVLSEPATYCAPGRKEMASGSTIGQMLRARG